MSSGWQNEHRLRRPLPPCVAGKRDSVARLANRNRQDPCRLVRQVNQILTPRN